MKNKEKTIFITGTVLGCTGLVISTGVLAYCTTTLIRISEAKEVSIATSKHISAWCDRAQQGKQLTINFDLDINYLIDANNSWISIDNIKYNVLSFDISQENKIIIPASYMTSNNVSVFLTEVKR